ncbi:MAG: DNA polymerase III subunit delta [Lachnospiraceae bacterium]
MQGIINDIKDCNFKTIYLLFGEEDYLRKQYKNRLTKALISEDDTMNYHYFYGKNNSLTEVIDLAETLPFLAQRRVIVLENTELLKKGGDLIADYLTNISESTTIIFVEREIDKRSRLYKAIKSHGKIGEFREQTEGTLKKWIYQLFSKEGRNISERTISYLLEKIGTDMDTIYLEVEKLICYTLSKEEITIEDVDQVCVAQIHNQIFKMLNEISERNVKKALEYYNELLLLKEPPMKILALLTRQFNLMLQIKELKLKGYDTTKIAKKTSLQNFVVEKSIRQTAKYKMTTLFEMFEECVRVDEEIKTGQVNDRLAVEVLIIKFSNGIA